MRLFGKGKVFERGSPEFRALLPDGDERILPGTRCIIWVDFDKGEHSRLQAGGSASLVQLADPDMPPVGTSCGFSVPFFSYEGERLVLDKHYEKLQDGSELDEETGLATTLLQYWSKKNSLSIDSMPGLRLAKDLSIALVPPFDIYKTEKSTPSSSRKDGTVMLSRLQLLVLLTLATLVGMLAGRLGAQTVLPAALRTADL